MLSLDVANCPECDGAYDRENHAVVDNGDYVQHYVLCDFCHLGWFIERYLDGTEFRLPYHQRSSPVAFAKFRRELRLARQSRPHKAPRKPRRQGARVA